MVKAPTRLIFLILIGVFLYLPIWAQDQMYNICPLKVGERPPDAHLTNYEGKPVLLSDILNNGPTVIIFYRGAWCGYCTQHLAELNDIRRDIVNLGWNVIGITADQWDRLSESTVKGGDEIEVYSDTAMEVTRAFGLDWKLDDALFTKYKDSYKIDLEVWSGQKHHSLPVPSIYLIKDGLVQFQYVNPDYKIRMKPETLLAVLESL